MATYKKIAFKNIVSKKDKIALIKRKGWFNGFQSDSWFESGTTVYTHPGHSLDYAYDRCMGIPTDYERIVNVKEYDDASLEDKVFYLKERYQYSTTTESKCIRELIDFYENHKDIIPNISPLKKWILKFKNKKL